MTVFKPNDPSLAKHLTDPAALLIACFCAAWCDTCTLYQDRFEQLAKEQPQYTFVWIDIEDHPTLLGDEDIENFPTILVEKNDQALFFGTMLPHIQQLDRLLTSLADNPDAQAVDTALDPVRLALLGQ